ncbi:lysozyme [Coprinopsis marcescibilis]|uniref:Lysozyme n=1 Tax=Coprinopsis marcescibilis TaxID=230819 RepID=A0A5C3KE90_COPMA|nr:lysozyme [Coprinopsis marcescibilis]
MKPTLFSTLLALASAATIQAAINDSCNANGTPGVCLTTASCSSGGRNLSPCTNGICRFSNTCASGNTVSGLCPGPAGFTCCLPGSSACNPAVNAATLDLIKLSEGFVPRPAPDPIGLPTVGYGHLCQTTGCAEVPYPFPLTTATASSLLISDLRTFQSCIARDINDSVRLNDNQFGALVSWAFNVGCGNAQSSTLIRRLNAGEAPNTVAAKELPKWNKAGGEVLPGLVTRRAREVTLFRTASSVIAHPC